MSAARLVSPDRVLRHSSLDAVLVGLSVVHAAALLAAPSVPLVAVGLWWNANTIAHNFIHRPFFRGRAANRTYALFLSAVLGLPQAIWRERHLAHHADRAARIRISADVVADTMAVLAVWTLAAVMAPHVFWLAYLPGWGAGLGLCWLQGHYEHAGGTTSHYGRLYNLLFFNDGYHIEHHARPGQHWSRLPAAPAAGRASAWPPVLRWLEAFSLDGLERLVLRSPALQRAVLRTHERACRELLPLAGDIAAITIVGGGLFPRSAIVLRRLFPAASIVVLDANAAHLEAARAFLDDAVVLRHGLYRGTPLADADLVVIPLAYLGRRSELYDRPPSRALLVHDWIWSRRGHGAMVSPWLLKRLNLIVTPAAHSTSVSRSA